MRAPDQLVVTFTFAELLANAFAFVLVVALSLGALDHFVLSRMIPVASPASPVSSVRPALARLPAALPAVLASDADLEVCLAAIKGLRHECVAARLRARTPASVSDEFFIDELTLRRGAPVARGLDPVLNHGNRPAPPPDAWT